MSTRSIYTLILISVAVLLSSCGPTQKVKRTFALNDLSLKARAAARDGDDRRSLELWQEYVERRPHAHFAQYELGVTESRMGMYTASIGHLTTAHDLRPGNVEYIETLGDTFILAGRADAMMSLMQATAAEGGDVSGQLRVGRYAQRVGMLDEAKQAIGLAMMYSNGESVEPYLAMADFARQIGDAEFEESSLRKALWFDPGSDNLDSRFLALGITPGPSLAIDPAKD
ncbi:MAG: hypothetical protein JKY43_07880 [Phycisphaerales bacterium]|nr:hypothetical protein [Phycisphaerales bacterium]